MLAVIQAHACHGHASGEQAPLRHQHFVYNAIIGRVDILCCFLLVAAGIELMDAADSFTAIGSKFRRILGHAGGSVFLSQVHMGNEVPLLDSGSRAYIDLVQGAAGESGNPRHAGRIHDQSHAIGLDCERAKNRPYHHCQEHHGH